MKYLLALFFFTIPTLIQAEVIPKGAKLEVYSEFTGGLNTRDEPNKLKSNESPYLRNVIIDDGEVQTTNGFISLGSTPTLTKINMTFEYVKSDGTKILLVSDSSNVLSTADFNIFTNIRSGQNNFFKTSCIQVEDKAWCTNGFDSIFTFDGSSVTILDGKTYGSVKTPNVLKFSRLAYWQNRVWGYGIPTNSSYLGYSAIQSTDTVPVIISPDNENAWSNPNSFINVDKGDGSQSTFMKVYHGQLYVGKERGISAILGDDEVSYADVKVVKDIGFLNNDSVAELDNVLIGYGSDDRIYEFDGRNINPISDHIRPDVTAFINNINKTIILPWETTADFNRGEFFGTTIAAAGLISTISTMTEASGTLLLTSSITDNAVSASFPNYGNGSFYHFTSASTFTAWIPLTQQMALSSTFPTTTPTLIPYVTYAFTNINGFLSNDNMSFNIVKRTNGNTSGTGNIDIRSTRTNKYLNFAFNPSDAPDPNKWYTDNPGGGTGGLEFTKEDIGNSVLQMKVSALITGVETFDVAIVTAISKIGLRLSVNSFGRYVSDIATTTSMTVWGNFNSVNSPNSGSVLFTYRAATSTVNISTYPFLPIAPGSVIGSSVSSTFVQWSASMTGTSLSTGLPTIDNVEIEYRQGGANDVNPFASTWKGKYWLAITTTTSGSTSLIYVKARNTAQNRNAFTVLEGINIKSFWRSSDIFYAGASTTGAVYRLDYGTNFDGSVINSIYETNEQVFGAPFFDKQLVSYFVDIDKRTSGIVTLGTQINNGAYSNYSLDINGSGRLVRHLAYPNDYFNSVRFRFTNTQSDKPMKINHFGVVYIPDVKQTDNY